MDCGQYFEAINAFLIQSEPEIDKNELSEILYTMGEEVGFPDSVDSVSIDQAILLWRIVETLKSKSLPDELIL